MMDGADATSYAIERLESERRGDHQRDTAMDHGQLSKFLEALDVYQPTIPEEVTHYYIQQAGVNVIDPKIKKIMSLATEKLVFSIIHDAHQQNKLREQGKEGAGSVLQMEDLVQSLKKYGAMKVKLAEEVPGATPEAMQGAATGQAQQDQQRTR